MMDSNITIAVNSISPDIKWGGDDGLHEKITTILLNGVDKTEFNKFTAEQITALKKEITPAAKAYKEATKKSEALDEAIANAKKDGGGNDATKLTTLINAFETFKDNTATAPVAANIGGSKRGGSKKRRGESKTGGSKRRGSKRRKH